MSTLEVNTINPQSGTTITIGGSGDTVSLGSGATQSGFGGVMTPAFEARLDNQQSIGDAVDTKIQYNSEIFDTDGCYDNSTNYRFTPTTAGKYYVYAFAYMDTQAGGNFDQGRIYLFKNGSNYTQIIMNNGGNFTEAVTLTAHSIIDFNGTTDYVEAYAFINDTSGTPLVRGDTSKRMSAFGAYRIIE
jgi:hypothetical protein